MSNAFPEHNIITGAALENPVRDSFRQRGLNVANHQVTDSGVDVNVQNVIVIECLNWLCGGYIHLKRWRSIIRNLLSYPLATKLIVCVGVVPTLQQYHQADVLGIEVIHADTVVDCIKALRQSGVITIEPAQAPIEPVSYECPYSSIDAVELDMWNVIYSDLFSD